MIGPASWLRSFSLFSLSKNSEWRGRYRPDAEPLGNATILDGIFALLNPACRLEQSANHGRIQTGHRQVTDRSRSTAPRRQP